MKSPPTRARNPAAGFSLTEVVVALGVATVAIVSILALFPVGFDTVRESAAETQAAVLARTIASDLVSGVRARGFTNSILLAGNDNMNSSLYRAVNLSQPSTNVIAYRYEGHWFGVAGYEPQTLKAMTDNLTSEAATVANADFLAAVAVEPVAGMTNMLAQVTIRISAPASVTLTNRVLQTSYSFLVGP